MPLRLCSLYKTLLTLWLIYSVLSSLSLLVCDISAVIAYHYIYFSSRALFINHYLVWLASFVMFWIFVCFWFLRFFFCFVHWRDFFVVFCLGGLFVWFWRVLLVGFIFAVQMSCSYRYLSSSLTSPWNLISRCCCLQLSLLKFCQLCWGDSCQ